MMTSLISRGSVFRNADFVFFLIGRSFNVIGVQILTVAVGWYVYQLTHDPLDLGYVGLAQFAPSLILFLVAGYVSDRFDRRLILIFANVVHIGVVGSLMGVLWNDWGGAGAVLLVLVVHGIARTFYHTASQAILPNIVETKVLPVAVAYSSSANKAAQLLGPALGGSLVAWADEWTYYVAASVFGVAVICSGLISRRIASDLSNQLTIKNVLVGFNYVWQNKVVLGAISIDLAAVLLGGVMGLLPIYASDILDVGPDGLGFMRAMPGVGALLMALGLAQVSEPR